MNDRSWRPKRGNTTRGNVCNVQEVSRLLRRVPVNEDLRDNKRPCTLHLAAHAARAQLTRASVEPFLQYCTH